MVYPGNSQGDGEGVHHFEDIEVYHWPTTTKYDPVSRTGGLCAEYINTFLKLKQEASGWPYWCQGDEALQAGYVDDYHQREGNFSRPGSN